jgi:hypothetical protein
MSWIKRNLALTLAISISLIINEYTLLIFTIDGDIDGNTRLGIRVFNFILVMMGYLISKNYIGKNFIVVLVSFCVPVVVLEIVLRTTSVFDQLGRNNPSYIPPYLRIIDSNIYDGGGYITSDGFRTWDPDIDNLLEALRTNSGCKIVALGDSFVMGAGLKASHTWPAKLNDLTQCTVYPFGRNGWTSLEQFDFYQEHLAEIDFDMLLVGIVSNDPHPRGSFCGLSYPASAYLRRNAGPLSNLGKVGYLIGQLSYTLSFIDQILSATFSARLVGSGTMDDLPITSWGYTNWEQRLYLNDVYSVWEEAIKCFYSGSNHNTAFLLTPTTVSSSQEENFLQIQTSLLQFGIPHRNLYPEMKTLLGEVRSRDDWANLADGHPGERQTTLYAAQAFELVKEIRMQNDFH